MRHSRALIGAGAAAAVATWWFTDSAPYPYSQRWLLDLPLPFLTLKRLDHVLQAREGERILEIGPGTGLQSLHVAPQLGPNGQLDIVDIQQEMLDHVMREAGRRGVTNVTPTLGDAQALPFEDNSIDGAVLVTVLGEIPDQEQALREIARVLRPGGRLVVGELFGDPHMVTTGKLTERAGRAGLELEQRLGSPLAFFARLRK